MHFKIFYHEDLKCTLKVDGEEGVREFNGVQEAVQAAQELSDSEESPLTVYDTMGTVIVETNTVMVQNWIGCLNQSRTPR